MIEFRRRSLWQGLRYRLWPPYRRRQDEALRAALRTLIANPTMPCIVAGELLDCPPDASLRPCAGGSDAMKQFVDIVTAGRPL